ncbi:N/A [soil metagenome]
MSENFIKNLPPTFVRNVLDLCGGLGEKWFSDLPQTIEELSRNWHFKTDKPFDNLSYNYVAPCKFSDGKEAVLKLALPLNNPEIFSEEKYLGMQNGKGAVKILNFDKNRRAMLLEKLKPGKHLKEIFSGNESETVEIAINLMKKLHRKPPESSEFILLEKWFENFFSGAENSEFSDYYLNKTKEIFYELSKSSQKFLLHGDLHHENILSAEREPFLIIDPKGLIGEISYEIAVFLNNHLWWLSPKKNCEEKLDYAVRQFSEAFNISQTDLKKWAFAQIVLSAWWTFEDGGGNWQRELGFAEFWKV